MPPSVIQNAQLYFRDYAIYFSFVDAHGARHQLSWPVWLLQEMSSIKLANSVQTHVDNLPELNEENITFAITESSTRRLVYLLSTTYLLVSAIHNFIRTGLAGKISLKPVSLLSVTDIHCDQPAFLRILKFLATHGIIQYDEQKQTIALTPSLGVGMSEAIKLNPSKFIAIKKNCDISFEENILRFSGTKAAVFTAIYDLGYGVKYLHIAAKYSLFDIIKNNANYDDICHLFMNSIIKKQDQEEISRSLGKDMNSHEIDNLLAYLCKFQFIACDDQKYQLTELGEYLCLDHPETLQPVLAMLNPAWWRAADAFEKSFMQIPIEQTAFQYANECGFFQSLAEDEASQSMFNYGLATLTKHQNQKIIDKMKSIAQFSWQQFHHIVDVAGGAGGLLSEIQKQFSNDCMLTLYDQASVIHDVKQNSTAATHNWKYISGNFFLPSPDNKIPRDNDLYIMKGTLHDFDDTSCVRILSHLRDNVPKQSTFALIERILPDKNQPHINYYGDLMMMMLLGGRGRKLEEWLKVLSLGGFKCLNAENEIEDHTIMLCKPASTEIPRSLMFFASSQSTCDTLCAKLLTLVKKQSTFNISIESIQHHPQYQPEYVNLLLQAICMHNKSCKSISYKY